MIIRDPQLITKWNPTGQRTATQADIDLLQRISAAFAHISPYVMAYAPLMLQEAWDIIDGRPVIPPMTEGELRAYMDREDAMTPGDTIRQDGMMILDMHGNVIT